MSDDNRATYKQIGEEGGTEALALVADIMERNARQNDALMASLYEGERAAHEETKARLHRAEDRLAVIHERFMRLLDPPTEFELRGEK